MSAFRFLNDISMPRKTGVFDIFGGFLVDFCQLVYFSRDISKDNPLHHRLVHDSSFSLVHADSTYLLIEQNYPSFAKGHYFLR